MVAIALVTLAAIGLVLVTVAATGCKVIQEVAWHDLEEYCERRQNSQRFDQIHDDHDEVILGMDTLRSVGSVLFLISAVCWFAMHATSVHLEAGTMALALASSFVLFLLLSVWLPSALAEVWGTEILYRHWPCFALCSTCMRPLARVADWIEAILRRLGARPAAPTDEQAFEDEVMTLVTEGLYDGHLGESTREMIEGVIELPDRDVADIMTPRSQIDAMQQDLGWEEAMRFAAECGRTRIPVYGEDLDQINGILYVKDLLPELCHAPEQRRPWTEFLRAARFVSRSQRLHHLLQDFRVTHSHVAIVRDEYGSTDGLVTIEDVLEEIVGEIEDELDEAEEDRISWINDRTVDVEGNTHVTEINERLGLDLPEPGDFDTVAGFVINHLRRIPKSGESFDWNGMHVTVLSASRRRIERIRFESTDRFHAFTEDSVVPGDGP